jgi:two-component system phosphate regulon sensor histidine kinase PhoR
LSNVSHELKTPLASIKAYSETLLMGAIKDESKNVQFITQIELSADRLAQQIQDLLQLSRVESGSMVFEIGPVSLNVACRNCINRFQSTAMNSMIDLRFDEPAADVIAMADEEGVGTILDNLVSNAIRYTPENGSVTLSVNHQEDWAVVSISDTGIGIAPDKQQRVFERFYRVDKARSREAGGTGLGLSIVKHLVHAFGGNVELSSKLGRGSTFRILLKKPENPAQANA